MQLKLQNALRLLTISIAAPTQSMSSVSWQWTMLEEGRRVLQ